MANTESVQADEYAQALPAKRGDVTRVFGAKRLALQIGKFATSHHITIMPMPYIFHLCDQWFLTYLLVPIDIYRAEPSRRRECLYYLALGHYKMGNYEEAKNFNGALLSRPLHLFVFKLFT